MQPLIIIKQMLLLVVLEVQIPNPIHVDTKHDIYKYRTRTTRWVAQNADQGLSILSILFKGGTWTTFCSSAKERVFDSC